MRTQHALSTEVVEILEGGKAARSVAYVTATHFGVGEYYGEVSCSKFISFCLDFLFLFGGWGLWFGSSGRACLGSKRYRI